MSRMKRLKKEKIKATISGLALMIAIGAAGGIGSYAWFSDQAEAKNDLVVTMGNLHNDIYNPVKINIDKNNINSPQSSSFYIENKGSLNQNVAIKFIKTNNSIDSYLGNIGCNLTIRYVNGENDEKLYLRGKEINTVLDLLNITEEAVIVDSSNTPIVLKSGDKLELRLTGIKLQNADLDILKALDSNQVDFNIEANSYQVANKEVTK